MASARSLNDLLEAIEMTVHLTRIYTRTGDHGQIHLGDGTRIDKTSPPVEVIADVDELNAQLGVVLCRYLNRLSDLLFLVPRPIEPGIVDLWQPAQSRS